MELRYKLGWLLGVAMPRFRPPSTHPEWKNRFMQGRQAAYQGWRDRVSGRYVMRHNRLDYQPVSENEHD